MRKIMILMNVLMGFFMSLVLSLAETLTSGHFTMPSWLASFGISFGISLIIGFLVPIKRLGDCASQKFHVVPHSFKGTLISAAISDLIYTPVITVIMAAVMLTNAAKNAPEGTVPPLSAVLIPSLAVSLIVGYVAIAAVQSILMRVLSGKMPNEMLEK